jgi:hypothetical protein
VALAYVCKRSRDCWGPVLTGGNAGTSVPEVMKKTTTSPEVLAVRKRLVLLTRCLNLLWEHLEGPRVSRVDVMANQGPPAWPSRSPSAAFDTFQPNHYFKGSKVM